MTFRLSQRSLDRLRGVHPDLCAVVHAAIGITRHDFAVTCGLRTHAEQRRLVERGLSQTMNSRHLDGHAVDLVAWHDGQPVWDWPAYYLMADAMLDAADSLHVPLRWGGAWHADDATQHMAEGAEALSASYVALRRSEGRRPFLDGPHFELPRSTHPSAAAA